MEEKLIAPCGMNCNICAQFLAQTLDVKSKGVRIPYCIGCRPRGKTCAFIKKRCEVLMREKVNYCYECDIFPCENLQKLDKRYKSRFHMSMIQNLKEIKSKGVKYFLKQQEEQWKCSKGDHYISCHNGLCFVCDFGKLQKRKKKYDWE
jgi:hypothetical protein